MITVSQLLLCILALFIPPLTVFLKIGFTFHFFLNILLCFLFWIPAIIHAWWVVFTF